MNAKKTELDRAKTPADVLRVVTSGYRDVKQLAASSGLDYWDIDAMIKENRAVTIKDMEKIKPHIPEEAQQKFHETVASYWQKREEKPLVKRTLVTAEQEAGKKQKAEQKAEQERKRAEREARKQQKDMAKAEREATAKAKQETISRAKQAALALARTPAQILRVVALGYGEIRRISARIGISPRQYRAMSKEDYCIGMGQMEMMLPHLGDAGPKFKAAVESRLGETLEEHNAKMSARAKEVLEEAARVDRAIAARTQQGKTSAPSVEASPGLPRTVHGTGESVTRQGFSDLE